MKVYYRAVKSLPFNPILSQMNPVKPSYYLYLRFILTLTILNVDLDVKSTTYFIFCIRQLLQKKQGHRRAVY
jgi:hypothetical protein